MAELKDLGEPGFYQERLRGRKTGRLSPRAALRGPRREAIYAAHGLIDAGAADPSQGQLFPTSGMERSIAERAADAGVSSNVVAVRPSKGKAQDIPLGAAPGFMPGLSKDQKIRALQTASEALETKTPTRDAMSKRQFLSDNPAMREHPNTGEVVPVSRGHRADWYSGIDPETGQHDLSIPGMAQKAIGRAAQRQNVSRAAMTRAVAITSPRNRWDEGMPGQDDYVMPNLESGEGAIREARSLPADASPADVSQAAVASSGRGLPAMSEKAMYDFRSGLRTTGEPQGTGPSVVPAGVEYSDVGSPIEVRQAASQKVPNFEASLRLSDSTQTDKRVAAESWTADTHDLQAVGVPDKYRERKGMYEFSAMTGARQALRDRQLPPNVQAAHWEVQRDTTQRSPLGPLFKELPSKALVENPEITSSNKDKKPSSGYRSRGESMGLEF
jgi:hypothetical protein